MNYQDYIIDFERLNELTNPVGYNANGINAGEFGEFLSNCSKKN